MHADLRVEFWDCFWEGDFEKNGKRRFHEHYAHVRSLVPEDRLLEFNLAAGWEPLCKFLDVPVPDQPFPRTNDTNGFVSRCQKRNLMQALNASYRLMLFGTPLVAATWIITKAVGNAWAFSSLLWR